MEEMKQQFSRLLDSLNVNSLGTSVDVFGEAQGVTSSEPADVKKDLTFSLLSLKDVKLVDYSYLKTAVEYFRPIINGFLLFLMGLYWYKEFLSFIGQAHNMGHSVSMAESHLAEKEGRE